MKAFTVFHNGRKICTAGVGRDGVLSAIVNWGGNGATIDEFDVHIGGLDGTTGEFVDWTSPDINVGDEITVRVVEVEEPDQPARRRTKEEVFAGGG